MSTPFGSCGVFTGIAAKNGIATRARKSGAAFVSVTTRWLPLAFTPETGLVDEPTTSDMKAPAGDCIFGSALRSNAALNEAAVTREPSENFVKPVEIVKSYVLPLFETFGNPAAASGTSCEPAGPFLSG